MSTFGRLCLLMAPFWRWAVLAVLLAFCTIASGIALVATASYLISKAAVATEIATLALAFTSVRVFAILRAVFRYFERLISHAATFRVLAHLRAWFYEAIEPAAPARLEAYRSGDLLARSVADIQTLEGFYVRVLAPPFAAALVVACGSLFLNVFDTRIALVLLSFLCIAGIVLPLTMRRLAGRCAGDLVTARAEFNALLVDEIQGAADLLAFDQAASHRGRVLALSAEMNRRQERLALLRGLSSGLASLCTALAAVSILWIAVPLVTNGSIDGVYLALLPLTAIACFEAVQPLSTALQHLDAGTTAGRRIFELIDAPPDVREPVSPVATPPRDFGIQMSDVSFRYTDDGLPALDRVSLALPQGKRLAVIGASGAGKSTLVNLLLRFWEQDAGTIALGGVDIRDYPAEVVRACLGVMPQNVHLFDASVRDNLILADPEATDDEVEAACRLTLAHEFIEKLPEGYDTRIGENGHWLSGGERQRLALARVVLKDAPIIVLDEPTANLDVDTERRLMESLEPFLNGRTVLIISHRPAVYAHADEVIELAVGRVCSLSGTEP